MPDTRRYSIEVKDLTTKKSSPTTTRRRRRTDISERQKRPRDRSQKYRLLRTQIALPALLRVHTLRHEGPPCMMRLLNLGQEAVLNI